MGIIRNVVFDFGGVIVGLDREAAVQRFLQIGVADAGSLIDKYHQKGLFLEVEEGRIGTDEFCERLGKMAGRNLSYGEVKHAWLGFVTDVPQYKLDFLLELREKYKVYLLSNTNSFVMSWARSNEFTPEGRPLDYYVDKIYASNELGAVKPGRTIFELMIDDAPLLPKETLFVDDGAANIKMGGDLGFHTYLAKNEFDWREDIAACLKENN